MPGLLVSVRSACEAEAAVAGGASVIDIKEPSRGPLGRADGSVWKAVLDCVGPHLPVSAALGELSEWEPSGGHEFETPVDSRLSFVKIGLSNAGGDWTSRWRVLRRLLTPEATPRWVAVAYLDWQAALAPAPDLVVSAAIDAGAAGLLVDTWDKTKRQHGWLEHEGWLNGLCRARESGLFVCLAGGLDVAEISRLRGLNLPIDLFGVRGSACARGNREGQIEVSRVKVLVMAGAEPGAIARACG